MDLIEQIKSDEGFRQFVYQCPSSRWTIGYGRNVDERGGKGLSEGEAGALLRNDVAACTNDLFKLFGARTWGDMGVVRQNALVNMRFQLGGGGFRKFERMIVAVRSGKWIVAAMEATNSIWTSQTPNRAHRIADELRDGVSI